MFLLCLPCTMHSYTHSEPGDRHSSLLSVQQQHDALCMPGDIARDTKESAQASPKQALLPPASPQALVLRRPVPGMKASPGRLTHPRSLHHRPYSSPVSASDVAGRQQQQLSSLHGFAATQQPPQALPRQPRIATVPSTDQRPSETMPKAQPECEQLYLPAGAAAATVKSDEYGAARVYLQNSAAWSKQGCPPLASTVGPAARSRQWYPPQASNTGPADSLTTELSTHQDYRASAIPHADVSSEPIQQGPLAAVIRAGDAEPGNFASENVAKPGHLHHQPLGVPGIESRNTSMSETNEHHG